MLAFRGGNVFSEKAMIRTKSRCSAPRSRVFRRKRATRLRSASTATRPLAINVLGDNLYFPTVDLTKNVCELVDFYGDIAATYDYAPFGAVAAGTPSGAAVPANPFQWSSEFYDSELGLVYYNYRHYSPSLGRFLSRDPIEEQGGLNLYVFVGNNFSNGDYLGTISITGAGDYSWNVPTPITGLFVRVSLGVEGSWFTCCKGGKEVKMISLGGEISIEAVTGSAFKGKVRVKNSRGSKCRDRKTGRFVKCPEDGKGGGVAVGDFIGDSKECPKSTFYFQASIVGTFSVGVGLIGGSGGFDFPIYPKVSVPDLNIGYSYGTVGAEVTLGVKGEFRAVLWEGDSVSI
ncbi:MAG: RHS repeat-associated core domain-containing protein [Candidatus Spyradosoma sp.]